LICRDLLGHDLSNPEEMEIILEEGKFVDFCPGLISYAIEIVGEILSD